MNEIIVLDIKGGRFLKAEEQLNDELKNNPSFEVYFSLMLCKVNLMFEKDRTMDEIIYCFKKSLELVDSKKKEELISSTKDIIINILKQLSNLHQQLEKKKKEGSKKFLIGSLISLTSMVVGSNNNSNAFTQIASLGALGGGVGLSLDALDQIGDINSIQKKIIETGNRIISEFIEIGVGDKIEFNNSFVQPTAEGVSYLSIQNKGLEELKETYFISNEDFIRMSVLVNSIKLIAMKNFKENEELKKEWENLNKKYNISFMKKADLMKKLKENPIH